MKRQIVNDECPLYCLDYDYEVERALTDFKDSVPSEDTLEVMCPRAEDCDLRFEYYFKRGIVRTGLIGNRCVLSELAKCSGQQGSNPVE